MSARERLHAALAVLLRSEDADRLIHARDGEVLRRGATAIRELPQDDDLDPGRADSVTLLRTVADVFDGGGKDTGSMTVGESTRPSESTASWVVEGRIGSSGWKKLSGPHDRGTVDKTLAEYQHWYPHGQVRIAPVPPTVPAWVTEALECARCGCTEDDACEGGCHWVPTMRMQDLCSACVNPDGTCTTPGCGTPADDLDESDPTIYGWLLLRVAGTEGTGRWVCSPWCLGDVLDAAAAALVQADSAAALDDAGLTMTSCSCSPDAKWPCGHCRHDECGDCHLCAGPGCAGTSRACTCTAVNA